MIHEAQCNMTLAPGVYAKPTKVLDASSHIEWRTELANVSPSALGGKTIRLEVKGENAARLFKILAALKDPTADVEALVKELRSLHEGSNPDSNAGPNGECAA